mgnify:CR=1 FL=1
MQRPHPLWSEQDPEAWWQATEAAVRALPAERGGRVPAAALTAYTRPEDRAHALGAGFQVHLPKPVDATQLMHTLASMIAVTG